jgi:hypothetical protein
MSSLQSFSSFAPTAAVAGLVFDHRLVPGPAADVEVIVKRRRVSSKDEQAALGGSSDRQPVHAPKTYRITTLRRDEPEKRPHVEAPSGEAGSRHEAVEPGAPHLGKRKRRVLNGRVTIIRPGLGSEALPMEPAEASGPQQHLRDRPSELGPFRMRAAAERRYDRLMKAIQRLEIRAAAARRAEAAAAVRWIRRTMARYEIRACEVGA